VTDSRHVTGTDESAKLLIAGRFFEYRVLRLADDKNKKISASEVRKTVAVSLAAAFGFVIALLWNQVVTGGLKVAGIDTTFDTIDFMGWLGYVVTAVAITVFMIVLIIVIGRWGNK